MQEIAASYSLARSRNLSRYRSARAKKCAAMRAAKARKRIEAGTSREPAWQPPDLRRIIVVIDLDSGTPRIKTMHLHRGDRIDSYRVHTAKGWSRGSVGWSRVLAAVRKRMPRAAA